MQLPALALLGALLVGAPQLYGGVFPWTVVAIAITALSTLVATLWATRGERGLGTPWVALAICGAAGWTWVQAMPLPCGLVAWLAPESAGELRSVVNLLGSPPPTWCTLSRDAGATRLEVLKGVAIVATFLAAWRLSLQGSREHVIYLCACSTLVMSVVAHLHMALRLDSVFGLYKPVYTGAGLQLAPLMNPNNLGAFAALGVPIWLGNLLSARTPRDRAIAGIAIVLTATTALLSLSRGAVGMLFGCIALLLFLLARARKRSSASGSQRWLRRLALGLPLACGIAVGAYLAADRVLPEFQQGGADKLNLIVHAFRFTTQHPWVGVGRGAFGSVFVQAGVRDPVYYAYAENFIAQWANDWGFPVTLLLLVALGHALWSALREAESLRRLGALVGVIGLAFQNLFDLNLELAGVSVVASGLFAAVVAPSRRLQRRANMARPAVHRVAVAICAVGAVALLWLGPSAERDSTNGLEGALRVQLAAKDRQAFRALLERAVRLHPTQPVFAVLAAGEALVHDDRRALGWINRAMRLAPAWTAPHLQAFQWLWRNGRRPQALLELRAAAELQPRTVAPYVCHVARLGREAVSRAAPRGRDERRAYFLEQASSCIAVEHPLSREIDSVLRREFPDSSAPREREAMRLARQGKLESALAELDAVHRQDPARAGTGILRVQLLYEGERYAEAAHTALALAQRADSSGTAARLWTLRARALAKLDDDAGWTGAIAALRRQVSDDIDRLADTYALEGELHLMRGHAAAALRSYREAYRIKDESRYLATYAELARQLGDRASALWAFMRLCEVQPHKAAYCKARDDLLNKARAMNLGSGVRN